MDSTQSGVRFFVIQCLSGFAFGVGAGVLAAMTYLFMPGLSHTGGHAVGAGAFPDVVAFFIVALFCFPILGTILGVISGTVCADLRRRRGLRLGAVLGIIMGLGLIGLAPFLRIWGEVRPMVLGPMPYRSDDQMNLCLFGNFGFAVMGAILGGIISWRPRTGNALIRGVAYGVGAGFLASQLVITKMDYIFVCGVYAFVGFTINGALLAVLSQPGRKPRWAWAAVPALLLWGPVLGFVSSRAIFHAPELPATKAGDGKKSGSQP